MADNRERGPRLPPRWFIRLAWWTHRAIYRVSGGRVGLWRPKPGRWGTLRLTTTGRRTGRPRSVFVGYFEDGPNLVTLAMNGWADPEPAWWRNLQAQPDATVELVGGARAVRACVAQGAERSRLWARWSEIDRQLDAYAAKRSSPTAVVILEPRPDLSKAHYQAEVEKEWRKAHRSSVWLLLISRVLRAVALLASAATPVLVLLNVEKLWTALVSGAAAVALGLIQLTSLDELSLLDRTRADRLRRALRCFDTKTGPYSEPSDKDQYRRFVQEVETIRLDWERNREALVRRSFLQRTDGVLDQSTGDGTGGVPSADRIPNNLS